MNQQQPLATVHYRREDERGIFDGEVDVYTEEALVRTVQDYSGRYTDVRAVRNQQRNLDLVAERLAHLGAIVMGEGAQQCVQVAYADTDGVRLHRIEVQVADRGVRPFKIFTRWQRDYSGKRFESIAEGSAMTPQGAAAIVGVVLDEAQARINSLRG